MHLKCQIYQRLYVVVHHHSIAGHVNFKTIRIVRCTALTHSIVISQQHSNGILFIGMIKFKLEFAGF